MPKRKATSLHRVTPGAAVDLAAIDPADTSAAPGDKATTVAATTPLVERLGELQDRLWAEQDRSVLLVLQGMDTSGKSGTIDHVLGGVNPIGLRVTSFKAPSASELAHDYLWRVHSCVPVSGELGVFDRSHYEDVLVVRVEDLVADEVWRRRYTHINEFERMLVDEGTTVVKCMLNISKAEQGRRLQARLDDPTKQWKFNPGDLDARKRWDDYIAAYEEALERTGTDHAPWHIIPANKKWYRNWAVATILVGVLQDLDPQWPEPEHDPSGIVIP